MIPVWVEPAQGEPFEHRCASTSMVIGRSKSNDLPLADAFLSRHHARIYRDEGRLMIEDLGSRNGTLLNGRLVERPTPMSPGDRVQVSSSFLRILDDTAARDDAHRHETIFQPAEKLLEKQASSPDTSEDESALRRYAERLAILNELHRALAASVALEPLLELLLDGIFDYVRPEEAVVFLTPAEGPPELRASRRVGDLEEGFPLSQTLLREVVEGRQSALVFDAQVDSRFSEAESIVEPGVQSLIAAPLLASDGCLGMIAASSRVAVNRFDESDLELLTSLAALAALRIRNISLTQEAAEARRMDTELELARRIQVALLKEPTPRLPGYEIHAGSLPSRRVSGDFYRISTRPDAAGCILMVADVAGKGIAASLVAAALEALSAAPIADGLPATEICGRLSDLLFERTPPEKYATAFLAALDTSSGRLEWVNAGHQPPLILRADGSVERLEATGLPLGLVRENRYQPATATLAAGNFLVVYTDGLTEAESPTGAELGIDRLIEAVQTSGSGSAREMAMTVETMVEEFVAGRPPLDDRTLVILRRTPS